MRRAGLRLLSTQKNLSFNPNLKYFRNGTKYRLCSGSSKKQGEETSNKYLNRTNVALVSSVLGVGGLTFAYFYSTDRKFKKVANEMLPESVVNLIRGPVVRPSPFSVSEEKLKSLSMSTRDSIGRLFLQLDMHNERGFSKMQFILLLDKLGYDLMHEAVAQMWYDMLLLSEEEEEEEERNVVIPDHKFIITVFELNRDVDKATETVKRVSNEWKEACKDAENSWWLLGLGSRSQKNAVAREKAEILSRATLRAEELEQRLQDLKASSSSYRGDDIVSLDEYLVLIAELSRDESEEIMMDRFRPIFEMVKSSLADSSTSNEIPTIPFAQQQVKPVVVPPQPQQQFLEEVELSERAVIEHELNTVLEKRRKFLRDMGEKLKSEWSITEIEKLSTYESMEAELREELNNL